LRRTVESAEGVLSIAVVNNPNNQGAKVRLTELTQAYQNVLEAIESTCDEGGQIDTALAETLAGISGDLRDKLGAYAGIIVHLKAQQGIIDAEVDRLKRQSKSAEAHIDYLKATAKAAMKTAGMTHLEVGVRKLRIQANGMAALVIADESKVPDSYWYQPPKVIDNEGLRGALKAGVPVEGCELVNGDHLRVM